MTTTILDNATWRATARSSNAAIGVSSFLAILKILVVALFCQVWFPVSGFTVRFEDIVTFFLLGSLLLPVLLTGTLRYRRSILHLPLLLWGGAVLLGVGVTLLSPFDGATKKDALVNGVRLALALGLFFVVYQHPAPAERKLNAVVSAMVIFSFITTSVALLQMGYWDGWLPFTLPEVLTTFKEGANTQQGRELFALYLGDTGSHTWSSALAMQALLVWLLGRHARNPWRKGAAWLYFGLLVFILIRVSVRNSILGLFVAIIGSELLGKKPARDLALRMLRPLVVLTLTAAVLVALFALAPDLYYIERVRQAIPTFENGQLVISGGSNVYGRLDYWATALKIFADSPIVGGGFYSYQTLSGLYMTESIVHAHNSYAQTLAELGIIGAFALSVLIVTIGYYLAYTRRYFLQRTPGAYWWQMVAGSFIFLAFAAIFGNPIWSPNHIAFRMILLGVLASVVRGRAK